MITQTRLMEVLDYDAAAGEFKWKTSRRGVKAGDVASHVDKKLGYIFIGVDGKRYQAHRLAWLYTHGSWPVNNIDHINGVRADNSILNLRDVTQSQNSQNSHKHRNGRLVGTYFHKPSQKWRAHIYTAGKLKYLGCYATEQLAHTAYLTARHLVVVLPKVLAE